jgi:DnaK suppressor protein
LKKQGPKYGHHVAPGVLGRVDNKGPKLFGKCMGKSRNSRPVKKSAPKVRPKAKAAAANGSRARAAKAPAPRPKVAKRSIAAPKTIVLPEGYRPAENEPFMNERHKLYFRNKLVAWKEEIVRQNRETLHVLHEDSAQHADIADRATSETDRALELRARDRQRKLIAKIDAALARIEDGSYGYCEETGEPIGLKRLDARPIATLSLEAQERHERREKVFRED